MATASGSGSAPSGGAAKPVFGMFAKGGAVGGGAKKTAADVLMAAAAGSASSSSSSSGGSGDVDRKAVLPWIEKYRPSALDDLISHTDIISTIKKLLDKGELPHLLLYGPPGTGKTSTILAIARQLNGPHFASMVLELNASDDRGIDVVREQIKDFASSRKLFSSGLKLVILDEADSMTSAAQMALRRVIEAHSKTTRFCLIANYIHKLIPALQSRCTRFRFGPLKAEHIAGRLRDICTAEGVRIDDAGQTAIMKLSGGDMRKVLNILQACHMAYGVVTEANVYLCTGNPVPADVDAIFQTLWADPFAVSFAKIAKLQAEKGLSLVDIVQRLHEKLLQFNGDPQAMAVLFDQLSNVEYRLAFGTSEKLQLGAVVGAFWMAREKMFANEKLREAKAAAAAAAAGTPAADGSSAMTDDAKSTNSSKAVASGAATAAAGSAKPAAASSAAASGTSAPAKPAAAKNLLR